jgi:transposase
VPQLWPGAVVMMDNLSAHKIDEITPIIESVGASVINISPYSPDFNPIEHWWSQLKSFIKTFSPRTTEMVDILIAVALHLVDSKYLRGCLKSLVKKLPKLYTVYEKSKYHETKQWEYKENHILQI